MPVASEIKISLKQFLRKTMCELNCRKIQHSAGKGLKINFQGKGNTVIGNNIAFIQQISIFFLAVIH